MNIMAKRRKGLSKREKLQIQRILADGKNKRKEINEFFSKSKKSAKKDITNASRAARAHRSAQNRAFVEEQRRHLRELNQQQKQELAKLHVDTQVALEAVRSGLSTEQGMQLARLQQEQLEGLERLRLEQATKLAEVQGSHQAQLHHLGMLPQPGTFAIVEPTGVRTVITEEQRKQLLEVPHEKLAAERAKRREEAEETEELFSGLIGIDPEHAEEARKFIRGKYPSHYTPSASSKGTPRGPRSPLDIVLTGPGETEVEKWEREANEILKKLETKQAKQSKLAVPSSRPEIAALEQARKLHEEVKKLQSEFKDVTELVKGPEPTEGTGATESERDEDLLYNDQIDEFMQPLEKYGFIGTYMADDLAAIPSKLLQKRGSLIMNNEPNRDPKTGKPNPGQHWLALYWDLRHKNDGHYTLTFKPGPHNQNIFYYDSFGRKPSDGIMEQIKQFMDKIRKKFDIKYEILFDYNKCKEQDMRSSECGWFAMQWLTKMYMHDHEPAFDCLTSDTKEAENDVKEFKEEVRESGEVPVAHIN